MDMILPDTQKDREGEWEEDLALGEALAGEEVFAEDGIMNPNVRIIFPDIHGSHP
jgi:hypothetical protein